MAASDPTLPFAPPHVNRKRRALFSFAVTFLGIGLASTFVLKGLDTEIARRVSESLLGLAEITVVSYIGGSSIDYGMTRWASRGNPGRQGDDPCEPRDAKVECRHDDDDAAK